MPTQHQRVRRRGVGEELVSSRAGRFGVDVSPRRPVRMGPLNRDAVRIDEVGHEPRLGGNVVRCRLGEEVDRERHHGLDYSRDTNVADIPGHCPEVTHRENYDLVVGNDVNLLEHPMVSAAVGTAAMAVGAAEAAYRAAGKLPIFGPLMRRGVAGLSERGDRWVAKSADQFKAQIAAVAVGLVDLVLDELDLNALVRERLDIDALAADLDIEAVINRVDLITLADRVIEGVDLPAIIRESTNSMTAEVMTDVRTQGERADDVVAGIVDRMLRRGGENR